MPKLIDHDERRRDIAEAAIAVIDAVGLEGARLRDVAGAAAVTTGAVTHYFDGKDAVLEAALAAMVRRILARQREANTKAISLLDFATGFLPVTEDSRKEWRVWLAFWGRAMTEPRLRSQHKAFYAAIVEEAAAGVRRADPRLTAKQAERAADALIAAIDGVGVRASLEPDNWPPERQRKTLAVLLNAFLTMEELEEEDDDA